MTRLIVEELRSTPAPTIPPNCPPMPPATVLSIHGQEVEANTYRLMEDSPYWQRRLHQHYADYEPPGRSTECEQDEDSPVRQYNQIIDAADTYTQSPVSLDDDRLAANMTADHVALYVALLQGHDLLQDTHTVVEEAVAEQEGEDETDSGRLAPFRTAQRSPFRSSLQSPLPSPRLSQVPLPRHPPLFAFPMTATLSIGHRPHPIAVSLENLHYVFHLAQVAEREDVAQRVMAAERAASERRQGQGRETDRSPPPVLGAVPLDGRLVTNGNAVQLPSLRHLTEGVGEDTQVGTSMLVDLAGGSEAGQNEDHPGERRRTVRFLTRSPTRQLGESIESSILHSPVLANGGPAQDEAVSPSLPPLRESSTTPTQESVLEELRIAATATEQQQQEDMRRVRWLQNRLGEEVAGDEDEESREAERREWARD